MMAGRFSTVVLVLCVVCVSCGAATMTNSWAVQVTSGGREAADALASKYGFVNLGLVSRHQAKCMIRSSHHCHAFKMQVGNLKDMYHFLMPVQGVAEKKSISELPTSYQFTRLLESEQNVKLL